MQIQFKVASIQM